MLSYRHAFHAGNHADVLKHLTLCLLLRHLNKKDKPYFILDTHAGAGLYDLTGKMAQKNREYRTGIFKILSDKKLISAVPEFYEILKSVNSPTNKSKDGSTSLNQTLQDQNSSTFSKDFTLDYYPGSPFIAASMSRPQDLITLTDLHPTEYQNLVQLFKTNRKVTVRQIDAVKALKSVLPPPIKRGLVFIDPPYEVANEYRMILQALKEGIARFNTGIFALWYPVLSESLNFSQHLVHKAAQFNLPLLQAQLTVSYQNEQRGMTGSGMLIFNYPYLIEESFKVILPRLCRALAVNQEACFNLNILVKHP